MIRNATKRFSGCRLIKNRLLSTCNASSQKHKEAIVPYSMKDSFRYTPEDGYVRTSAFNDIQLQNLTIDQYIWQDLNKFQDNCAIVSRIFFYNFDLLVK